MERLRGAVKTLWSIVTHPLGHGSPIPKRGQLDEHERAIAGDDALTEAITWLKANPTTDRSRRAA
jgi:hypothetical protein